MQVIGLIITAFEICLFGRIILSWFPMDPNSPLAGVARFTFNITEPVLGPIRSVLPRTGMLDLSPLVLLIGIQILASALHVQAI